MSLLDPKSDRGQQIIRNAAYMQPTTPGDPPPLLPKGERILTQDEARELMSQGLIPAPFSITIPPNTIKLAERIRLVVFGRLVNQRSSSPLNTVGMTQWNVPVCLDCRNGFFEYIYATWWQCRDCGAWCELPPRKD